MFLAEEDFWFLLHNAAHWEFEIFLMIVFDVIIGMIAWPLIKRAISIHDVRKHSKNCCPDIDDLDVM